MNEINPESSRTEVITLGEGCFWCTEAVFSIVRGVKQVEPGYAGGALPNPTYEQVSTGTTGHAEVAQITYDPSVISLKEILVIFFATHDPTTMNRQGPDVGTQYRSIILYTNEEQKEAAEEAIAEITKAKTYSNPIVTKIEPLRAFYKAEDYHKDYFKRHLKQPYCQAVIAPKIEKLQKYFKLKINLPQKT
jgi:peptide-methionine (S)-S-oxide reductase